MIYDPAEDSFLLKKEVEKYSHNKIVLDMGSGSGIQALAAKKAGAKSVICADINKEAIEKLKGLGFESIKSNLFSNIKGKFDLIIFNPPYLPKNKEEDKESARITSGGKKGDEIILKFIKQSIGHLNKNGIILIVISSLTPKNRIINLLKEKSLAHSIISEEKLFMEKLEVWKIKINEKV